MIFIKLDDSDDNYYATESSKWTDSKILNADEVGLAAITLALSNSFSNLYSIIKVLITIIL